MALTRNVDADVSNYRRWAGVHLMNIQLSIYLWLVGFSSMPLLEEAFKQNFVLFQISGVDLQLLNFWLVWRLSVHRELCFSQFYYYYFSSAVSSAVWSTTKVCALNGGMNR